MTLISAEKIHKAFDQKTILEDVSFMVVSQDKIGLVGKNGCGKTTLFEILTGNSDLDAGRINTPKKTIIDYARQEKQQYTGLSLFDYVATAREDLLSIRQQIKNLEEALSFRPTDKKALEELGKLHNHYEHENGFTFENEIKIILSGLGFDESRYSDRLSNFSGGEKNRAALARILAGRGNLLLLDEPTNHLDIESTQWLEEYLNQSDKSYIIVSHDRTFLNNTVNKVWELKNGRLDFYAGTFDKYISERSERIRLKEHHFKHQQQRISQLEEFIRKNMAGQKTKQAQSKQKYLDRMKRLPPPESEGHSPNINIVSSGRSYSHIMAVENASVGYGDTIVVDNMKFDVYRGDKIGIIGSNGSGKSTMLKSMIGELAPISGDIKLGNNVTVSYFDQELSDLDPSKTVIENLWEEDPAAEIGLIRSFLGRFGFSGDESFQKVSSLSGGEKTKLSLAKLLYHPANFIIFDEPTNHLDIVSREALEEALKEYDGSFIIVSHDRYFLDKVVTKIIHLKNNHLSFYEGNYSYFKDKSTPPVRPHLPKQSKSKQNYLEFKEKSKRRARLKKDITSTRDKINELETNLSELVAEIDDKIPRNDWEKLQQATLEKNNIEEQILQLYSQLEELEQIQEEEENDND